MNIGLSIRSLRKSKGLSQGELCRRCNISQTFLSQVEKNLKRPSTTTIRKICDVLNIPEILIYLTAIEEKDIPLNKREVYNSVCPQLIAVIKQLLTN